MAARGEKKKVVEKVKYPFFFEHIDTEQLAYKMDEVKNGMFLVFTEKLHGTSQRTAFTIEEKPLWYGKLINGIFKRTIILPKRDYNYVCGTRRVVLKDFDNNRGFYGDNEKFREFVHKEFVGKLQKGETVYYEVVGYAAENTPLMPVANNAKLQDKDFVKKYGKQTRFKYGCKPGQFEAYVYRITMTNEDGTVVDLSWDDVKRRCRQMDVKHVPELFRLVYVKPNENKEFFEFCDKFAEGDSILDTEHIREGIVVRADGSTWNAWKYKSFQFKVLEDIIKLQNDTVDIEEAQDV
jgi:hypothetical protein